MGLAGEKQGQCKGPGAGGVGLPWTCRSEEEARFSLLSMMRALGALRQVMTPKQELFSKGLRAAGAGASALCTDVERSAQPQSYISEKCGKSYELETWRFSEPILQMRKVTFFPHFPQRP